MINAPQCDRSRPCFGFVPSMFGPEHRQLVCGLYRKALKGSLDWIIDRRKWRPFALSIRLRFDEHKGLKDEAEVDRVIKATQTLLYKYRHPEPYKYPTAPGGVMWDRQAILPKQVT